MFSQNNQDIKIMIGQQPQKFKHFNFYNIN